MVKDIINKQILDKLDEIKNLIISNKKEDEKYQFKIFRIGILIGVFLVLSVVFWLIVYIF
jgi:hypothetical protein